MSRGGRVDVDALQARVGLRIASRLSEVADGVPHDIAERLRVAREQALQRARVVRAAAPARGAAMQVSQGSIALGSPDSWWLRLASILPLVMLLVGFLLIGHLHEQAEIHAAAEVDAALLADDLPPEAYGDPGFLAFLKQPEP
jgi:hypothetical protein